MSFSFFDHTGDIGVRVRADTLDGLFAEAAHALTETVTERGRVECRRSVSVDLESSAVDVLLVEWLNEIVYRFEVGRFLVGAVDVRVHGPNGGTSRSKAAAANEPAFSVRGRLHGETFDPVRHGVKVLVKAVTYHALEVRHDADGWQATIVFDI